MVLELSMRELGVVIISDDPATAGDDLATADGSIALLEEAL